jgi:hypothetical protein
MFIYQQQRFKDQINISEPLCRMTRDLQVPVQWGSPIPFPTGGACVLSVIRFQDGGRRSAGGSVPKLEYDILRRNASTNVLKTYLIESYILH